MHLKGSYVALVTPFRNGEIDSDAYRKLIEFQIEGGTDGILVCGTTGEAATMSMKEHKSQIRETIDIVDKRVPVMAGTGSNSTAEAVELTEFARKAGCDSALVVTPYYNKPTPEGLYRHFSRVAAEVDIPVVLYNVPGRTGVSLPPSTIARLSEIDNIVAVKEASGSVQQVAEIRRRCEITVLSGDDSLTLPFMSLGAEGVVSVAANIIPDKIHDLVASFMGGDMDKSREIHFRMMKLCGAMFLETNPLPVKTSLAMMGKIDEEWRLPLCEMRPENRETLKAVLEEYGLI